jgi:predicted Zn-dependent peptidase
VIAAIALLATANAPVRVLEMLEDSPYVVVQTYIKAPAKMGERETAAWQVLGRVLLEGTIEYTPQTLRDYGSQAGIAPSVTVMPDFMRLQIVLPKSGLSLAGDLTFAILTRPALREEDIAKAIVALSGEERTPWVTAMSGVDLRYDRLRQGDVRQVWTRAVRPENMNFVVGGGIDSGAGKQELETRFERWTAPRDPGPLRADGMAMPRIAYLGPVSTFILGGRTMTPASTASAAKLVAVFALGVGKESSMHRVLREGRGLSYLQSAVLWPTSTGWTPYFTMVRRTTPDEGKYAVEMRDALAKDIEGWSAATLQRAQAMTESAFSRNFSISPIWLSPSGPMTTTLSDRCAWRGYLEMVGSGALREEVMVGAVKNVDLDQLKEQAKLLLEECNVGWLPGRP